MLDCLLQSVEQYKGALSQCILPAISSRSVAGFWQLRNGFTPIAIHVEYVEDKMVLDQICLQIPVNYNSPMGIYFFIHYFITAIGQMRIVEPDTSLKNNFNN
jgi:hypothetical protein